LQPEEKASIVARLSQGGPGRNGYAHCETDDQFHDV
jgi:hypothetical protein